MKENGRVCRGCGSWKSADNFYPFSEGVNGLYPTCRRCESEKRKAKSIIKAKKAEEIRESKKIQLLSLGGQECNKCGEFKSFTEFYEKSSNITGYRKQCKDCTGQYYRKPHYRDNREIVIKKMREYRKANREEINKRQRGYRTDNPEKFRQNDSASYLRNRDKKIGRATKYQALHPEMVKVVQMKRRAQKNKCQGSFTYQEWIELCQKYGNKCIRCGNEVKLTVDHVVPLSKGGSNDINNIQPLCKHCNCKKHTKTIDYRPESYGILNGMLF